MKLTGNYIWAIILSAVVMMLWQYFYVEPQLQEKRAYEAAQAELASESNGLQVKIDANTEIQAPEDVLKLVNRAELVDGGSAGRALFGNGKISGSVNLKGAVYDDLSLANYRKTSLADDEKVSLLNPKGSDNVYYATTGWVASGIKTPDSNSVWKLISNENNVIVITWDNGEGFEFKKSITLDKNYMITEENSVVNASGVDATMYHYGVINRYYATDADSDEMRGYTRENAYGNTQNTWIVHQGAIGVFDKKLEEVEFDDLDDDNYKYASDNAWLGFSDRYWQTAFIPAPELNIEASFKRSHSDFGYNRYQADFRGEGISIKADSEYSLTTRIYAGAKEVDVINDYAEAQDIPLFDRVIDWGWFSVIVKPMYAALKFFYSLVGNFGVAILLLTICVKVLLFPLAYKSFASMAKMREVMPELKAIKEKNKDNPQAVQKEMMGFYKKKGINPAAGCLPIFLQIPIFFSLYKVLYIAIEMRHAPFYAWLKDLSLPDPTSIINLFGLLPFEAPAFLLIGVLPIAFGVSMYIQQKLNPTPADATQAAIMRYLPFIFVFLFAGFPAGLVMYWTWNNILTIAQQYYITRRVNKGK